ncbi:S1 family peptidase [Spirosoma radiotolerans]|uniref:Peptidase S1 domain-containing protein n=1 Tax=Spirosoma radiotolerans TaxID=1379870 RepID=A0A0E3ZYE3_9BACT|nr:serine protease [Spirosoma radiotolerans]AKD56959.1 hypothetical protein SD10_20680 [Spirosoma radiotolerans]
MDINLPIKMDQQIFYHFNNKLTSDRSCIGSILIGNDFCGSGFVVHNSRLIVTSAHNLESIDGTITYLTASDDEGKNVKSYVLTVIRILEEYDLALLESHEKVTDAFFSIAPEFNVAVYQKIYYYGFDKKKQEDQELNRDNDGNPEVRPQGRHIYESTISSIAKTRIGHGPLVDYIEYCGYCVPGFSGGVTMNINGEVIAVNTRVWVGYGPRRKKYFMLSQAFSIQPLLQIIDSLRA